MIEKTFISQSLRNMQIEDYLKKQLNRAGFSGMDLYKTPLVTRIVLKVTKPGLVIGKGGKNIKILTDEISEKFGIKNPQIEILEIENAELDAKASVENIVNMLERGYSWRGVAFRTVDNIMKAGAQGVELIVSGSLGGKGGRARKQRIAKGYMKKAGGQSELVDYAQNNAYLKGGAVGVKLKILKPGIFFPDKINIKEYLEKEKKEEDEKAEESEEKTNEKEKKPEEQKEKVKKETLSEKKEKEKDTKKKTVKKTKKAEEKKSAKKETKEKSDEKKVKK